MAGNLLFFFFFKLWGSLRLDFTFLWNGNIEVTWKALWRSWSLPLRGQQNRQIRKTGRKFHYSGLPQNEVPFSYFNQVIIRHISESLQCKSCTLSTYYDCYSATHSERGRSHSPNNNISEGKGGGIVIRLRKQKKSGHACWGGTM